MRWEGNVAHMGFYIYTHTISGLNPEGKGREGKGREGKGREHLEYLVVNERTILEWIIKTRV
jgi:hypothetical protein